MKLARHILDRVPNSYVYWPVPERVHAPSDLLCYPKDDRIIYFKLSYGDDRYREFRRLYYQQEKMVAHYGEFWDWDVLVTNRTPLVPLYRQMAHHHSSKTLNWSRKILVLEDFPQMSFKGAAAVPDHPAQDAQVVLGYFCADSTAINAYWEKSLILEKARLYFSPAVVRHLVNSIHEATPTIVEAVEQKTPEFLADATRPFTIGFAGRLILGHRFDKIFDVMEKNWVLRGSQGRPVRCLVSTQSNGAARVEIPSWVEEHKADRTEFHRLMREDVHVGLFFSVEEDYSMSLIEPLILGVPYAVYRAPWSEASLGPDYPFFFKSQQEVYVIVKAFYDDYAGMYAKFAEWQKEKFGPLLHRRNEVSIFSCLDQLVRQWSEDMVLYAKTHEEPTSSVVHMLREEMAGANTALTLTEALNRAQVKGKSRHIADKMEKDQFDLRTSFSTDRNMFRLKLMAHYGATDCNALPGSLIMPGGAK